MEEKQEKMWEERWGNPAVVWGGGGSTSPRAVPSSDSSLVAAWERGEPGAQQST